MKFVFLVTSYATIYLIYIKFKATYDHNHDTFRIEFLVGPAFLLALLINNEFSVLEVTLTLVISICFNKYFLDFVDIQYLSGIGGNFATVVYGQ